MLNKDIELLEGLVLVWGNDYLKTKKEESKTKYIDNFTKLINIYEQIYLEEIYGRAARYKNKCRKK